MNRIILASADAHGSPPFEDFRPYLESKYHAAFDEHVAAEQGCLDLFDAITSAHDEATLEAIDEERALRSGGRLGAHDPKRRLQEMDREGVAWELVASGTGDDNSFRMAPFCEVVYAPCSPELRWAGSRAFNRWLADMMSETDGRVAGILEVGPCVDMDAEVAELEWAAEHGFVAVQTPGKIADPDRLPQLFDAKYYERFWAACADLGLVLNVHAAWGTPQTGTFQSILKMLTEGFDMAQVNEVANGQVLKGIRSSYIENLDTSAETFIGGLTPQSRPPLWQLMLGGAFDRHPTLKLAVTELRADWIPPTLAALDGYVAGQNTSLELKPSEYFTRNVRVTPSFTHPSEVAMRHAIGVGQIMFGRDYPHPEGTWPNTWDWIRAAFADVPEDEARQMLGENAIDWFNLDRANLAAVADRIGPLPEDLLGEHTVDIRKIDSFDKRGGYRKPAERVDTGAVVRAFAADLALAGTS